VTFWQATYTNGDGDAKVEVHREEKQIKVVVKNPCTASYPDNFVAKQLAPEENEYWITEEQGGLKFKNWKSAASKLPKYATNPDVCGQISYQIVNEDLVDILDFDIDYIWLEENPNMNQKSKIRWETSEPLHAPNKPVKYFLKATMDDWYPTKGEEAIHYEPFFLNIRSCRVRNFKIFQVGVQTYKLGEEKFSFQVPQWEQQNAACEHKVDYKVTRVLFINAEKKTFLYDELPDCL